ncbi:MAG: hypothetical protein R3F17_15365 [Planctomycetota bacterium]
MLRTEAGLSLTFPGFFGHHRSRGIREDIDPGLPAWAGSPEGPAFPGSVLSPHPKEPSDDFAPHGNPPAFGRLYCALANAQQVRADRRAGVDDNLNNFANIPVGSHFDLEMLCCCPAT